MKLSPAAVRAVERGDKTEHRVLFKDPKLVKRPGPQPRGGKRPERIGASATYVQQPFRPARGDSLVIQTADTDRGLDEVRVIVTNVRTELLSETRPVDAIAEGYKTLADFAHAWMTKHSTAWPPKTEALCTNCHGETVYTDHHGNEVDCTLCDEVGTILVDDKPPADEILERFERKHGHHLVWVIQFEHQVDVTRWLHKRPYLPPTLSIGEAMDPEAPILGAPHPDWKQRGERLRAAALKDRDGARLAGLDRLSADLEAEALRLALESDADVNSLVREVRHKVDRIKQKVAGRSDQHRRAA